LCKIQGKRIRAEVVEGVQRDKSFSECEVVLTLLKNSPLVQQLSKTTLTGEGLREVEEKIKKHEYETGYQFAHDIRNMWTNYWINAGNNNELKAIIRAAGNYFEELLKDDKHKKLLNSINDTYNVQAEYKRKNEGVKKTEERPMSIKEKAKLKKNIMQLSDKELTGLLPIIQETVDVKKSSLEFDIEALPLSTCRRLAQYVKLHTKTPPNHSRKKKRRCRNRRR